MATGTGLTGASRIVIDLRYLQEASDDINEKLDKMAIDTGINWTWGTGVNQANVLFAKKRTIAQSASETLDLYASGTLKDVLGNDLTMDAIKLLYVKNNSTTLTVSVFGGGALDLLIMGGTTDAQELPPGAMALWMCPTAAGIVTTVNKNLLLDVSAGSGSAIIDVVALGLD